MKKSASVYKFHIWFKNADETVDYENMQERYVVAYTEEEAESKMERYRAELVANGFADFVSVYMGVDNYSVIV